MLVDKISDMAYSDAPSPASLTFIPDATFLSSLPSVVSFFLSSLSAAIVAPLFMICMRAPSPLENVSTYIIVEMPKKIKGGENFM